jgi:hypothetical protein
MAVLAFPSSAILDSTAAGRSILTAADAPAQLSVLGLGTSNSPTFLSQILSGQSLTGSQATSLLDLATTWNTTGTPTAINLDVTDTASNALSSLVNLRVGGSSRFRVEKSGVVYAQSTIVSTAGNLQAAGEIYTQGSSSRIGWQPGGTWDLMLFRDAANILAQRNGVNAQNFRVYNTFTDSSNYERGKFAWESNVLRIGTEKFGTGVARALEFQTDGVTRAVLSATTAQLTLQNSGGGAFVRVQDTSGANRFSQLSLSGAGTRVEFGMGLGITGGFAFINSGGWSALAITNGSTQNDNEVRLGTNGVGITGQITPLLIGNSFAPTFGTSTFVAINVTSTVNQTGGANGITRGLYINPTLTAAADFRAIESANGPVVFTDTYAAGSGSLTGPALVVNQTWNTSGSPAALQVNVTDTASAANSSRLLELRVGGSPVFQVRKEGTVWAALQIDSGSSFRVLNNGGFFSLGSSVDTYLFRDAAGIFAQRNGANAQSFRVYNTYTDASNYERGKFAWESNVLRIGTEKLGTGVARALEFQTDGVTRLTLAATGAITASARFNFAAPTTGASSANLPSGSDPTSPAQGDLWVNTNGDLRYRNASSTITLGSGGGGSQNVFSTIAVSGQSNVEADTTTDTLTLAAGSGISITTNATTDTVTISATGGGGGGGLSRYTAIALGW